MHANELLIREAVRDTIARYNFSGDRGRYDEMVDCFHTDGILEIIDGETHHGHAALRAFFAGVGPAAALRSPITLLRHCVTNTVIDVVDDTTARANSYFQVLTQHGLDHWGRYRDELAPDDSGRWLLRHRSVKTDAYAPTSAFLSPS